MLGVNARIAIKARKQVRVTKQQLRKMEVEIVRVKIRKHKVAAPGAKLLRQHVTVTTVRVAKVTGTNALRMSANQED